MDRRLGFLIVALAAWGLSSREFARGSREWLKSAWAGSAPATVTSAAAPTARKVAPPVLRADQIRVSAAAPERELGAAQAKHRVSTAELERRFDQVWEFEGGVRRVALDGKYGLVDAEGSYLVEPILEEAFDFSDGLSAAKMNGRFGYVSLAGKWVVPPQFDYAWPMAGGMGLVKEGEKYGYVNSEGGVVFPPELDTAFAYTEGLSAVQYQGRFGFLDRRGNWAIPPQFDYAWPFEKGAALVRKDGRTWMIDHEGRATADVEDLR